MTAQPLFRSPGDLAKLERLLATRLRAYELDRYPGHVLVAWRAMREAGVQPTERMLSYLDIALEALKVPQPKHRRPGYALRDVAMVDALQELTGREGIPRHLSAALTRQLAERFHMKLPAVGMAISRLRRTLARLK